MSTHYYVKVTSARIVRIPNKDTGEIIKQFASYVSEVDYDEGKEFAGRDVVTSFLPNENDFALAKRLIADLKSAHANLGQDFIYIEPIEKRVSRKGNLQLELVDYTLLKVDKPTATK